MSRTQAILAAVLAVIVIGGSAAGFFYLAEASPPSMRTWVSGSGDDSYACTRSSPCQTFARALARTAAGGEINCLDNGGFGTVVITKSVTIDCTGTLASVLASTTGVPGVSVNSAGIRVTVRNLSINGRGIGSIGLHVVTGAQVSIENSRITGTTAAVQVGADAYVSIDRATLTGNSLSGVLVDGAASTVYVSNSDISNNAVGVSVAAPTARAILSNNNLYRNGTQLFAAGPILTAANNRIDPPSTVAMQTLQVK